MPWCPGCAPQHSSAAPCPKKSPTGPSCPRWLMERLRSPSPGGPRSLHPHPQILLSPQPCPLPTPVALAWHRLAAFPTQRGRCQQRPALLLYGPPGKACRAHGPAPPRATRLPAPGAKAPIASAPRQWGGGGGLPQPPGHGLHFPGGPRPLPAQRCGALSGAAPCPGTRGARPRVFGCRLLSIFAFHFWFLLCVLFAAHRPCAPSPLPLPFACPVSTLEVLIPHRRCQAHEAGPNPLLPSPEPPLQLGGLGRDRGTGHRPHCPHCCH